MSPRPLLFVYKEIVGGDLRKLLAESNDSKTGGGARDLRLPWATFRPTMHRIFINDGVGRGGKQIRTAQVTYLDEHEIARTTQLEYWPPTPSRPREDRISKVHASPALGGQLPATDRGRIFVMLIKYDDGTVRCSYAYEADLRKGKWASEVSSQILNCMAAATARSENRTVQGYYDFSSGDRFCHAD